MIPAAMIKALNPIAAANESETRPLTHWHKVKYESKNPRANPRVFVMGKEIEILTSPDVTVLHLQLQFDQQ